MKSALSTHIPTSGPSFHHVLREHGIVLTRAALSELQINLGKLCNQACSHCHVDAGPKRTEIMTWDTMQHILRWFAAAQLSKVDITGGAPELNSHFRQFVDRFVAMGAEITCRCNLTVLLEPGQEDLAEWYADRRIRLVASLPCYSRKNVDEQRGKGVFDKSLVALKLLNERGYGIKHGLILDLVYNPGGAFLPPAQQTLESEYKQRLADDYGISFNSLLTLANLPINRFAHYLERTQQSESYQSLLVANFNQQTIPHLMCRHLLSVDWRGRIYDCDFNQMLELPVRQCVTSYLWDLDPGTLEQSDIWVDRHCFGCTAGSGSSCGGALA